MFSSDLFLPAQSVGYVALVLGVLAFMQKSDLRLKVLIACESTVYILHFYLLGNFPASGSAAVSCLRILASLRYKAAWVMVMFMAASVAVGALFARGFSGWLPVVGSCLATFAYFRMQGFALRLALLVCTMLWLANNILSHSIGGTVMEGIILLVNLTTLTRMLMARRLCSGAVAAAVAGPSPV